MSSKLSKNQLEKFSRQIILKDIGILGQKKILNSRVLIIGMGGLGCPVAEFLTRSGVGSLGIVDHDLVGLSNIHRQTLYDEKDLEKLKVKAAKKKLVSINSKYATKLNGDNHSSLLFDFNSVAPKDVNSLYHTIAIQSAEIPASYYNVNSKNNTIRIYEIDGGVETTISFTIPVGNYTADTFAAAFIVAFNAAAFSHDCLSLIHI